MINEKWLYTSGVVRTLFRLNLISSATGLGATIKLSARSWWLDTDVFNE